MHLTGDFVSGCPWALPNFPDCTETKEVSTPPSFPSFTQGHTCRTAGWPSHPSPAPEANPWLLLLRDPRLSQPVEWSHYHMAREQDKKGCLGRPWDFVSLIYWKSTFFFFNPTLTHIYPGGDVLILKTHSNYPPVGQQLIRVWLGIAGYWSVSWWRLYHQAATAGPLGSVSRKFCSGVVILRVLASLFDNILELQMVPSVPRWPVRRREGFRPQGAKLHNTLWIWAVCGYWVPEVWGSSELGRALCLKYAMDFENQI